MEILEELSDLCKEIEEFYNINRKQYGSGWNCTTRLENGKIIINFAANFKPGILLSFKIITSEFRMEYDCYDKHIICYDQIYNLLTKEDQKQILPEVQKVLDYLLKKKLTEF